MKKYLSLGLVPLCLFGLLAVFFWRGLSLNPSELPLAQLNQKMPAFEVPILGDNTRLFSSEHMQGHPAVLHVFASWCTSCAKEQVFLLKLADEGVPLYGLNYKDNPFDAMQWLQAFGNPYRMIGMDKDGHTGIDLGVYGTPETFLVDSEGMIRYRHVGILTADVWNEVVLPQWKAIS